MTHDVEIEGGAGPYETAAILAAIDQLMREMARSARAAPPRPSRNAWMNSRRSEAVDNGTWSLAVGQGEGLGA